MRAFALAVTLVAALASAGCLRAQYTEGYLLCSGVPGRECPEGSFCALNGYCYYNGTDLGPVDLGTPQLDLSYTPPPSDDGDMSVGDDMSASTPAPDLLPPPDLLSPPADLLQSTTD